MQANFVTAKAITTPPRAALEAADVAPPETETIVRSLLATQVQCTLATIDGGAPTQHLMAYAFDPSLEEIYLVTRRRTEKTSNMLRNPAVSLLWDNRTGNTDDHFEAHALMARGIAQPLHGWLRARAEHLLRRRSPGLLPLMSLEPSLVFAIHVEAYRLALGYVSVVTHLPGRANGSTPGQFRRQVGAAAASTLSGALPD